jgi:hypothetical protein
VCNTDVEHDKARGRGLVYTDVEYAAACKIVHVKVMYSFVEGSQSKDVVA